MKRSSRRPSSARTRSRSNTPDPGAVVPDDLADAVPIIRRSTRSKSRTTPILGAQPTGTLTQGAQSDEEQHLQDNGVVLTEKKVETTKAIEKTPSKSHTPSRRRRRSRAGVDIESNDETSISSRTTKRRTAHDRTSVPSCSSPATPEAQQNDIGESDTVQISMPTRPQHDELKLSELNSIPERITVFHHNEVTENKLTDANAPDVVVVQSDAINALKVITSDEDVAHEAVSISHGEEIDSSMLPLAGNFQLFNETISPSCSDSKVVRGPIREELATSKGFKERAELDNQGILTDSSFPRKDSRSKTTEQTMETEKASHVEVGQIETPTMTTSCLDSVQPALKASVPHNATYLDENHFGIIEKTSGKGESDGGFDDVDETERLKPIHGTLSTSGASSKLDSSASFVGSFAQGESFAPLEVEAPAEEHGKPNPQMTVSVLSPVLDSSDESRILTARQEFGNEGNIMLGTSNSEQSGVYPIIEALTQEERSVGSSPGMENISVSGEQRLCNVFASADECTATVEGLQGISNADINHKNVTGNDSLVPTKRVGDRHSAVSAETYWQSGDLPEVSDRAFGDAHGLKESWDPVISIRASDEPTEEVCQAQNEFGFEHEATPARVESSDKVDSTLRRSQANSVQKSGSGTNHVLDSTNRKSRFGLPMRHASNNLPDVNDVAVVQSSCNTESCQKETLISSPVQNGTTESVSHRMLTLRDSEPCRETNLLEAIISADSDRKPSELKSNKVKGCSSENRLLSRSQLASDQLISVKAIKIRIYAAGIIAHRGKGAEKLFSCYWGALCRWFGTVFHGVGSERQGRMIRGTKEIIKKFLTTKKLRCLHNSLIFALLNQSVNHASCSVDVIEHVPSSWRKRVRVRSKEANHASITMEVDELQQTIKSAFGEHSELWTTVGMPEDFTALPYTTKLSLRLENGANADDNSHSLPGALLVDPFVRAAAQREGLKVTENAVWLLVIGMREYIKSLLLNTVATVTSVNEFAQLPCGSALCHQIGPIAKDGNAVFEFEDLATPSILQSGKQKHITALDLASYLIATPVAIGYNSNRLAIDSCYLSAFDPQPVDSRSDFDSLRTFIGSSIHNCAPRLLRRQNDDLLQFQKTPPNPSSSEAKSKSDDLQASTLESYVLPTKPEKLTTHQAKHARRSPVVKGMGRGAKNLAALKARATAAAKNDAQVRDESTTSQLNVPSSETVDPTPIPETKDTIITQELSCEEVTGRNLPPNRSNQPLQLSNPLQSGSNALTSDTLAGPVLEFVSEGKLEVTTPMLTAVVPYSNSEEVTIQSLSTRLSNVEAGKSHNLVKLEAADSCPQLERPFTQSQAILVSNGEHRAVRVDVSTSNTVTEQSRPEHPVVRGRGFGAKDLAVMKALNAGSAGYLKDEELDHLSVPIQGSTAGANDATNESKGSEPSVPSSEQTSIPEQSSPSHLDAQVRTHEDCICESAATQKCAGQLDGSEKALENSPPEVLAQFNEQGTPLAYTA